MTDYTPQAKSALRTISDKGMAVEFLRKTAGEVDPVTGVDSSSVGVIAARAVQLPVEKSSSFPEALRGRRISRLLVAAHGLSITPLAGDSVVVSGVTWQVFESVPLAPNGQAIIHTCTIYV